MKYVTTQDNSKKHFPYGSHLKKIEREGEEGALVVQADDSLQCKLYTDCILMRKGDENDSQE